MSSSPSHQMLLERARLAEERDRYVTALVARMTEREQRLERTEAGRELIARIRDGWRTA